MAECRTLVVDLDVPGLLGPLHMHVVMQCFYSGWTASDRQNCELL